MEKVQNTVKTVSEFGDPDQYGNKNYWIEFTDGTKGSFRTPNNDLFVEGMLGVYSIKEQKHSAKAGNYAILQRYKEEFDGPKNFENTSKNTIDHSGMVRSVAVKAICELRSNTKISIEDIIKEADIIFDYLEFGITDEPKKYGPKGLTMDQVSQGQSAIVQDGHQKALTPQDDTTDELPF